MAYCALGSMSNADWTEIKKLCAAMRKEMDAKLTALETKLEAEIENLDASQIQVIKNQLQALSIQVQALIDGQAIQDARLDSLEENCANLEITTSEVLEAYNGA